MPHHLVARARAGSLLCRDHAEYLALWIILVRTFPDVLAMCVMPDHIHVVLPDDGGKRFTQALSAYARWRNAHRGEHGDVWAPRPPPEPLRDDKHLRRTIRYVHLNPCRAGLTDDPLAWPWSTHRDAVGFAFPAAVARERDPARFHRFVSGDPTVAVEGTLLPSTRHDDVGWLEIEDAVCGVFRVRPDALTKRGPARVVAVKTAWIHKVRDVDELVRRTGMKRARIYALVAELPMRGDPITDDVLDACVRAVGDPRFVDGALKEKGRGWGRYAGWR